MPKFEIDAEVKVKGHSKSEHIGKTGRIRVIYQSKRGTGFTGMEDLIQFLQGGVLEALDSDLEIRYVVYTGNEIIACDEDCLELVL